MLSLYDLKYHCRTCLIKIENMADKDDTKKYVSLAKYPEVEQIIRTCLRSIDGASVDYRLDLYMPNLCCICLEKWQDFSTHYLLAVKNYELLRQILEKEEPFESVSEKCQEPNKVFLESETTGDVCEIEKYETISPFYPTSRSNTPLADPQSEGHLNDSEFSALHDIEYSESLQSPKTNASDSEEELSLKVTKELQSKSINKTQTKEAPAKRTRTCRSKRKSKADPPSDRISDKQLNDSTNENASKKVAYRCEPCKKFFYGSITYEGHIKRVHEGVKKAYQCKECDKAYSFPHNLAEHIAGSHRKLTENETLQILQCEHCNKPYKNKASLTQHLRNHHQDCSPDSKRIICDQCGFLAAHQMSLAQHIKNKHTEVEEIKCEQCSKVFKSQYYLKYHMMSFHNPMNIKPFKCPQCPMAFTRRPRLNIHIRTHLNYSERIKCDFEGCDVRFVKLSAKRRHMRLVHLKVKQHVCDICGEAFGIKATLRHHRYIHTGEKPYKCNVCGQAFRQLTAMKTHRKMHASKGEAMTTTTTESDILSSLTQIDGGFEDSSNSFE